MTDFNLKAGISDVDYHGDRTTLSSTGARKLLACPARFRWDRDNEQPTSKAFEFGKLAHRLVLGEGSPIQVVDAENWMTKAAKELRDIARGNGVTPVLRADYDQARSLRDSVMAHPIAAAIFADGIAERSGYWRDEPTDIGLKFRPDWLTDFLGRPTCVDLKTTISADPDDFARSVAKYGYHAQAAWYLDGLAANGINDAAFLFVAVEKTPPYPVAVIELDDEALAEGRRLNRRAIDLYARCTDTGIWPAYGDDITLISLPMWALPELEITL